MPEIHGRSSLDYQNRKELFMSQLPSSNALFVLGHIVATPGALDLLDRQATNALSLLARHMRGDWGEVPAEDALANWSALDYGLRVLSSYPLGTERIWIITEADRRSTCLLLPDEY